MKNPYYLTTLLALMIPLMMYDCEGCAEDFNDHADCETAAQDLEKWTEISNRAWEDHATAFNTGADSATINSLKLDLDIALQRKNDAQNYLNSLDCN